MGVAVFSKCQLCFIYYNLKIIIHLVACFGFGGAGNVGNVDKDTIISYSRETVIKITFRYTAFSAYMCLLARIPSNARLSLFHNVLRNSKRRLNDCVANIIGKYIVGAGRYVLVK